MDATSFRARQRIEANDSGSTYADSLYDGWRDDALAALSRAVPLAKVKADFAVTAGTKEYPLPTDWITSRSEDLDAEEEPVYRLETAAGAFLYLDDDFTIYGRTLALVSAPTANATWKLRYGGTWLITDLPNEWVEIALDYATARMYERKATEAAEYFKYNNGVEQVDRDAESAKWRELHKKRFAKATVALAAIEVRAASFGTFVIKRA